MKRNKKRRMVVCEHHLTCRSNECNQGAGVPHLECPLCSSFDCEIIHERTRCVPIKEPTINNDDYLERLGIKE